MRFLGNIEAKLDTKGRVFLPVAFRKEMQVASETALVLRKDVFQSCLVLYPLSVWDDEVVRLRERLNKFNERHQQIFRQFMLDSEKIEPDSGGRILIPRRYLEMTGIASEVRFLGVDSVIEIWAKEKLESPLLSAEEFGEELQRLMNE